MSSNILVSVNQLNDLIEAGNCTVVDCRFDLSNAEKGRADWLEGHIPGAHYAHMDDDLASPILPDTGRHPLPATSGFAEYLSSIGWSEGKLLVAYDAGSNAYSARLWWLMRYYGKASALLDGGLSAWMRADLPLEAGAAQAERSSVSGLQPLESMTVSAEMVYENLDSLQLLVMDARAAARYSGEVEPLDSKAGHIPGAINRPFDQNLAKDGRFLDPETLSAQFERLLGGIDVRNVVQSCGSGVTACHNLFAMELAGMGASRLYPGSWSEWVSDPGRPVKKGSAP